VWGWGQGGRKGSGQMSPVVAAATVAAAAAARRASTDGAVAAVRQCRPSSTAQTSLPAHAASPSALGFYGF